MIEFRILGPLEARRDGGAIPLGGRKQRALLAYLLLRANQPVSTDELIEALWPRQDADSARQALRVAVSRLRSSLDGEATLATRPTGYELLVPEGQVDLHRFLALVEEGERAFAADDMEAAAFRYADALGLWRGSALADVAVDGLVSDSDRLEELRVNAIERHIEADLARGRHSAVVAELDELVERYPYREQFRRQQMLALYRSGRQAEALEAYRSARRRLVDDLGIEPSRDLQELEKAILRQDSELAPPASEPPLPAATKGRRRLAAAVVGVAILVLGAAAVYVFVHDDSRPAPQTVSAKTNSLVVLEEKSGRSVGNVDLGGSPTRLAVGAGAVWALLPHAGVVVRVGPRGETKPVGVPLEPVGIAVGAGGVWLPDESKALTRIDPSTVTADPPLQVARDSVFPNAIADVTATDDTVWLASRDTAEAAAYVVRTGRLYRHVGADDGAGAFFYGMGASVIGHGFGEVWLTNRADVGGEGGSNTTMHSGRVTRIAADSGRVLGRFELGSPPLGLAATRDAMWIAAADRVWRMSRLERAPSREVDVPGAPVALAADERGAWVATRDRQVLQIDPAGSRIVRRWRLDKTPSAVAVAFGRVWVAVGSRG